MRRDLVEILACPDDGAVLDLEVHEEGDDGDVVAGTLTCSECAFAYPIEAGVPNLLPPALHTDEIDD